ncbi:MAG TPA: SRPBCC family protein, partial [Gemmataceae bacterium]|nr:SRPBCC family protein [Gemmataceae bacterium]
RRGVDVHKAIIIEAPIEQVFSCWAEYDNFPRFLSGLREVHSLGNGQSRWVARGPEGMPIAWNAFLTEFVPDQMLAWRSDPDSIIPNTGMVRFEPHGAGNTRVDLRLCYEPLAGDLGDFAAELFGADERSAMDEDLLLLKALLEEAASRSSSSV